MSFFRPKHFKNREMSEEAIEKDFPDFQDELLSRLKVGAREYGDESFKGPVVNLVTAMMEECLDIAGWGFILWFRLRRLKLAYMGLEARTRRTTK